MRKLLFVMLASAALVSCSKDPNLVTNEALEGTWDITSYSSNGENIYGPDGLMDDGVITFTMDEDFTGKTTSTFTVFPNSEFESTETGSATYEISNEGATITITDSEGEKTEASISIEDATYTMTFTENSATVVQKATKR